MINVYAYELCSKSCFFLVCCVFENEKLDAINVYVGCLVDVARKLENEKH